MHARSLGAAAGDATLLRVYESVRPPAVAGSFYPAEPAALRALIDRLLAGALAEAPVASPAGAPAASPAASAVARPKALIAPHAGYVYSGPIAAAAFARIAAPGGQGAAVPIERIVLIGPAHRVFVTGLAAPGAARLRTPLGEVPVDAAALAALEAIGPSAVRAHAAAHAREHSLEVMLPFLQTLAPGAKIVPLVGSDAPPAEVGRVLEALWGGPETLIVVSSDLSHYLPYAEARARDERTAARISALDPTLTGDDACGAVGINGLLWVARRKGLRVERVDLRSSGDTAGGRDEVVGYGAFALHEAA